MPAKRILLSSSILLLSLVQFVVADDRGRHAYLTEAEFRDHVSYLASDELEGRGTGQEGIDKAAEYIADQFKEWGVRPGGDDGTYFQNFSLKLKSRIGEKTRLAIGMKDRPTRRAAKLNEDYVPFPFSASGDFRGEVVFAGYGIVNDELEYNDYARIDVTDKVVLVFRRGPKFAELGMRDSSFRAKASRAAARNAKAVLIVNPDGDEEGDGLFSFDSGASQRFSGGAYGIPMIHIRRALADRMLKSAGLPNISELQTRIEHGRKPVSAVLKGVQVRGHVELEPIETPVRNVIGMVPGQGPQRDEYIIIGGHYDHLGIRNKGTSDFNPLKDISNGADDNASGTTGVMLLARAYAQGRPPNRTMVFMLFTAEEIGLLGSAHYAKEPTIDLTRAVVMLNFDMIGRLKDNKLEVGGMRTADFESMVERLAGPHQLTIKDGGGGRGPSDHTSFYNKNIPVLFFFTGLHRQYHQPEDDTPLLNMEGAVRVMHFTADIIDEIDSRSERPVFKKDSRPPRIARQDRPDDALAAATPGDGPARPGRGRRLGIVPGMPDDEPGLPVMEVREGSPAEAAGMKAEDRILEVNGRKISGVREIVEALAASEPDQTAKVRIQRGDRRMTLDVRPAAESQVAAAPVEKPAQAGQLRARIAALVEAMRKIDPGAEFTISIQDNNVSFSVTIQPGRDSESLLSGVVDRMEPFISDQFLINVYWTMEKSAAPAPAPAAAEEKAAPLKGPSAPARRTVRGAAAASDAHGDSAEESGGAPMPPVRLGIMPTYGESDGPGYEISGVVDGGPAATAGMKDSDRILRIGTHKVTDVYTYMDALRKFKPGDVVEVCVLRDGEEKTLKIKTAAQRQPGAE